jgi:hypothetical protein
MSNHLREPDDRRTTEPARSSISEQLTRQSVVPMDCTIPPDMTIAQWRRARSSRPRPKRRHSARLLAGAARLVSRPAAQCDHLHDSTTRYDRDRKVLTFLLVCPVCHTEKVVETQRYEPRFEPSSVRPLIVRADERPMRLAA